MAFDLLLYVSDSSCCHMTSDEHACLCNGNGIVFAMDKLPSMVSFGKDECLHWDGIWWVYVQLRLNL